MSYVHYIPLEKSEDGVDPIPVPVHGYAANAAQVGPGTYYPVGLTLPKLCEMYWRFRGGDYELWEDGVKVADITVRSRKMVGRALLTDELQLICPGADISTADGTISFFGTGWILVYDDLYYPAVVCATLWASSSAPASNGLAFTMKIGVMEVPLYWLYPPILPPAVPDSLVKVKEYWWEYDPEDGDGPVYDVESGEMLRNPMDIVNYWMGD